MNHEDLTREQEELTIDSVEGLHTLLEYAEDVVLDIKELSDDNETTEKTFALYTEMRTLVEKQSKIMDLGGFLSEEDVTEMQTLYNRMLEIKDSLDEKTETERVEEETVPELDDEEAEIEREVPLKAVSAPLTVINESAGEAISVAIHETPIDTETVRVQIKQLKQKATTLLVSAEQMKRDYETTEDGESEEFKPSTFLYQQLVESIKNTEEINLALTTKGTAPFTEDIELFLLHAGNELEEFETNLDGFAKGLEWHAASTSKEGVQPAPAGTESPAVSEKVIKNEAEAFLRQSIFTKNELRPFIESTAAVARYKQFLSSVFTSPGAFEAYLRREIDSREAPSKLDKVLGIKHKSPFDELLRDMTLSEIESFDAKSSSDIRAALGAKDIQYEMYVEWMQDYPIMKQLVRTTPHMTFGELFAQAMVEDLMQRQTTT